MQRTLSKEQLADLAHQAVSSIRRFMSSSHDSMTLTQLDLLSTSKTIEERWHRKRLTVESSVVDMWATGFQEELLLQIEHALSEKGSPENSNNDRTTVVSPSVRGKGPHPIFISESAMLTCVDVLRILLRTTGAKLTEKLLSCHMVKDLTNYFMKIPFSEKMCDAFGGVLLEVISFNVSLLDECLSISESLLMPGKRASGEMFVSPKQVHLAWIISSACRHAIASGTSLESVCARYGSSGFLSSLIRTSVKLLEMGEGLPFTACLAYFGLISSLICGCDVNKCLCRKEHREDVSNLWLAIASNVWKVDLTMVMPTNVPGKDILLAVEPAQVWASGLTDFILELSTSNSFSRCRQSLYEDFMYTSNSSGAMPGSTPTSPSPLSSPGLLRAVRRYEPLPPHWDTVLLGGSAQTWRLASLLFDCVLDTDSCGLIAEVLLGMDTQNTISGSIYRSIISTLMLLCVATPRNAEILAKGPMLEALFTHVTYNQESAFPREVIICGKACKAIHPLKSNAVQLNMGFISLLNSLYFAEEKLLRLQSVVEEMSLRQTAQTDADIVESFLHVQSSSSFPSDVLSFSGTGSIVCNLGKFPGVRFHGYSFAAWVNPKCVWLEGSHLFSHTDTLSGSSVVLMIVANGRSCCLALRIQHSTEVTLSLIPDTALSAEVWSHVAFSHSSSGFIVFINGRRTEGSLTVPFPKEPTKKSRLKFAFGGCPDEPSFFGFITGIGLLSGTLSDKDVARMYQMGPRSLRELSLSCSLLLGVESKVHPSSNILNVDVVGSLARNCEGVSVERVVAFSPLSTLSMFKRHNIVNWALRTIQAARGSPSFPVLARLCVQFICTAMKMTTCDEELNEMTDENVFVRLHEDILQWEMIPIGVPVVLIACTIPRGGGKVMREHLTTQTVLSLLLDMIQNGNASPGTASCILRELSDSLLLPQNLARFREGPRRFQQILDISKMLPPECVENLVVLVERLCKEPHEMEQTLVFLLSPSTSRTAGQVKTEVLRMLFDISRVNTSICDLIGGAFGNSGLSFLIKLVGGMNHSSEAIRIYALRIISLMLHVSKKFREYFAKSRGYEILATVTTDPASTVPIRLPTYSCLFQMAFDALHPTARDSALQHLAPGTSSPKSKRHTSRTQHQDPNKGGIGQTLGLQGHLPGLVSQRLRVTRREYSFDMVYDFSRSDDVRIGLDDPYRAKVSGANNALQFPQAIQTILWVLEHQLRRMSSFGSVGGFGVGVCGGGGGFGGGDSSNDNTSHNSNAANSHSLSIGPLRDAPVPEMSSSMADALEERGAANVGDTTSTASVVSPMHDDPPDVIALRVLNHLEKIVDRPENGETLLPFPWLTWLWAAVERVIDPSCLDEGPIPRYSKKHAAAIQQRTRRIVRSLAILDMCRNPKAATVRIVRSGEYSPALTRLVLEAIVSHLTKRFAFQSQKDATNIITNLDSLFAGIEDVVHLPLALGVDIVNSISSIAVNNNSWVRMRMKNASRLFETRSHLAFVLLATIKKFSRQDPATLGQLLDANAHEPNTMRVILRRLVCGVSNGDVDEVEMLIAATRQLASADQNTRLAVQAIVGAEHSSFVELICRSTRTPTVAIPDSAGFPQSFAPHLSHGDEKEEKSLPTAEVMQWCREDTNRWKVVEERVIAATRAVEVARAGERVERAYKEGRARPHQRSSYSKSLAGVERITREVEVHLGRGSTTSTTRTGPEGKILTPNSIATSEGS